MADTNIDIIKTALAIAVISIGGWLVFNSLVELFNLDSLEVGWRLGIGLLIIWGSIKFGLKK